ncbi:unnamed protein product [Prorocentrum cordatum]|uniref:Uncharacterized protein n=1 Tax=Prorocentrum cordatum TaxID=2364126 RepID=A0ABN9SK26_9DINO|nr:unnamed protein product [Polarella glacialis]
MWSTENSRRSAGSPAPAVSLGRRALACARGGGRALGARRLPEATRRGGRSAGAPRKRHVRCQRSGKEGERERGERNKNEKEKERERERKRKRERERECERRLSPQLTTAPLAPQTARRHSRGLHVTRPGRRGSVQQGDAEASPGAGKARMAARWWHRTTVHAPVRREGPHQLAGTRQHWRWCPEHPRPSGESFEKTCPGATEKTPPCTICSLGSSACLNIIINFSEARADICAGPFPSLARGARLGSSADPRNLRGPPTMYAHAACPFFGHWQRTTTGQCCSRRAYRQEPVDELTQCRAAVDASQMGSAPPSPLQASCRRLRSPSRRPARGTTRPGPRPHWPRSTRGARARRAPCGGGRRAPPRRRAPPGRPQARGRANLATGAAGRPPPSWSGAREDVRLWRPGQAPPLARARAAEGTPRRTPPPPLGRGGPRTNGFCGTVRVVLAWPTHI